MKLSDIAVVTTACRRPYYLRDTLAAWSRVRGISEVRSFTVQLGLSSREADMLNAIQDANEGVRFGQAKAGLIGVELDEDWWAGTMHRAIGEAADRAFAEGAQFVVFGEEDVLVSTDTLEYMLWAANTFEERYRVLIACAHSVGGCGWDSPEPAQDAGADQEAVRLLPYYNGWGWGTWRERWQKCLRPDWEWHDFRGHEAGYDWNIQKRILPKHRGLCVVPDASRSQNIGKEEGVYSTEASFAFAQCQSFIQDRKPCNYKVTEEQ